MHGTGVSPGISIGTAIIFRKSLNTLSGIELDSDETRSAEAVRFDQAVAASVDEIEIMKENNRNELNLTEIAILETQIEFLSDPQIRSDVLEKISKESKTANDALIEVIGASVKIFENLDDEYMKERAGDIKDIGGRILKNLNPVQKQDFSELPENSIIIADDITPSDAISLDVSRVTGIATVAGGRTSHTAIIAKARGIPAVVGCGTGLMTAGNNDTVLIDGSSGEVIIRPDQTEVKEFISRQQKYSTELAFLKSLKELPAVTADGKIINLFGNISGPGDLERLFGYGGEGVGLFRTEMLFMDRNSMPDEEEQFHFYKEVAIKSLNKPVTIRTLDIGGDKQLPYLGISFENNPFLGYRAIRLCLDQKDIFVCQLRAILRASAFGNLKIMFPMISNISEVRQARECVRMAMDDLLRTGIEFDKDIEIGIMIEIPSAALMADQLAKEVSFFSIGTNDLCQYTLAVDRMNERVSALYTHFNPAVLRLIHYTIEQGHKHKIHVGLCGEMASDPMATILLLGMGLEEFSVSASSIPVIKNIIRHTDISKAVKVFNRIQEMDSSEVITGYLKEISK